VLNQFTNVPSASGGQWTSRFRALATIVLFAAAFFIVQRLTFAMRIPPFQRTTVWTPGALFFAALLLEPPRRWWLYLVGLCLGVVAAFHDDGPVPAVRALLAVPFLCAAVMPGAWAVRRFTTNSLFGNLTSLTVFVGVATVLVPVFVIVPLEVSRYLAGGKDIWLIVVRSLLAGALGTLIATPALTLTLANRCAWLRELSWPRLAELAGLGVGVLTVGHVVFGIDLGEEPSPALLYAPLPLLLWAAVRFELAGVCWALLALVVQSTWGAIRGHGPFAGLPPAQGVLQLQLFLLAISLPLMYLATLIREVVQEIDERRRSEERFRLVVEHSPNAILLVNALGRIVLVNSESERLFGYRREELIDKPIEVLVPERYRSNHPGHLAEFFAAPSARHMGAGRELFGRRRDGGEFPVEIGLTPIQAAGGLQVLCAVVDISARKRAEETRQELAHASRLALVGELTASIAHEINQPLGAILSNADAAEMLLDAAPPALEEVRQILNDIRRDDLRASEVIRRLRALLSKRQFEMQPLDLNQTVSEMIHVVRAEARRRNVSIRTHLAEDLPVVHGDRVQLQQVILNLLLNGMEALTDTSGEKTLEIQTARHENGAKLTVSDTGPGMSPDTLTRLFDPFFTTKRAGMGLGLSISRSLIERHGGRIWAERSSTGGATFRVLLPPGPTPAERQPAVRETLFVRAEV
jgi:PAS domain S-box-containing protein